jgi:hypothetical protein
MTTYRAKLIVERIEIRRPGLMQDSKVAREAVYDEIRIEVTALDADVALSKVINLARSEQIDRDSRKTMDVKAPTTTPFADLDADDEV